MSLHGLRRGSSHGRIVLRNFLKSSSGHRLGQQPLPLSGNKRCICLDVCHSTVQLQKTSVNGLESCVSIVTLLPLSESCYMRGEALFLEPRGEPPERFRAVWELSPEGWKWFRAVRSVVFAVSSWPGQRRPEASQARHALFPVLSSISANTSGRMASAQVTKRIMNHRVWINNLKIKENQ